MASAWWEAWGLSWGDAWGTAEGGSTVALSGIGAISFTGTADLSLIGVPEQPPATTGGNWRPALTAPRRRRPVEDVEALLMAGAF